MAGILIAAGCKCASSGPAPSPPADSAAATAPLPVQFQPLPLSRDALPLTMSLEGRSFPPLLRVALNGRDTWMVIDSGATYHALADWFAEEVDKRRVAAGTVPGDLPTFNGATITAGQTMITLGAKLPVLAVPASLRRLGIGGFLSPGFFFPPGGAAVVDLPGRRLRAFVHADDARAFMRRDGGRTWSAPLCTAGEQPAFRRYIVAAEINGSPARLEIDTGAESTYVFSTSAAGKALSAAASKPIALLGAYGAQKASRVADARVTIDGIDNVRPILLVAEAPSDDAEPCPYDGVIAMDMLAPCVVVLTDQAATVSCER